MTDHSRPADPVDIRGHHDVRLARSAASSGIGSPASRAALTCENAHVPSNTIRSGIRGRWHPNGWLSTTGGISAWNWSQIGSMSQDGTAGRWCRINSGFLTSPTGNSHRARLTATPRRHLSGATPPRVADVAVVEAPITAGTATAEGTASGAPQRPETGPMHPAADTVTCVTPAPPARDIVVLVSGSGTLLQALLDACADPAYGVPGRGRRSRPRRDRSAEQRAVAAGIPTFVCRVQDFPDAGRLGRRAHQGRGGVPARPGRLGRLPQAGRPGVPGRFGDRYVNSHNALLPSFPGIHGPRDALAYGVKVTGATLFVVDEGVDTGAIVAQVAVPVLDDDTEETPDRADQGGRAAPTGRVGRPDGPRRVHRHRPKGHRPVSQAPESTEGRRPIRRALVSVYDKTGLADLARRRCTPPAWPSCRPGRPPPRSPRPGCR